MGAIAIIIASATASAAQPAATDAAETGVDFYPGLTDIGTGILSFVLQNPLGALSALVAIVIGVFYLVTRLKLRAALRRQTETADTLSTLETRLEEMEALLSAEQNLLIIWQGKGDKPVRIISGLRGISELPAETDRQYQFETWLDAPSTLKLQQHIKSLRDRGEPFNIIISSRSGETVEADGRAAGAMATVSIRRLFGERLEFTRVNEKNAELSREFDALMSMLDRAPMPVWTRDEQNRLKWVNQAYLDAIEVEDRTQALEQQIELLDGRSAANTSSNEEDACDEKMTYGIIAGERRRLKVVNFDLANGSAGLSIDMTELEEVKHELDRHIAAHARTLDQITTAVAIFGADQRLRFFNAAYLELWQLDEAWLQENPTDSEIIDALREARHLPEQADYRSWKEKRLSVYTKADNQEDWWHLPDGRTIRVLAEQHPFGGLTYLYENVTEKLSLESRYNSLISVQRETLDNLYEGVALFGSDGRLKLYNPAYTSIWNLQTHPLEDEPHIDDVIKWCRDALPDDEVWSDIKQVVISLPDERRSLNGRLNRPDGSVIDFASVHLPDGATLLTYVDITDSANVERALRERADALETADRLKTEFISHISRELRTPLTSILGFSDSLVMGIAGELNPKQAEYVGYTLQSGKVLLTTIDNILDMATIDAGVMTLDVSEIKVPELISTVTELVQDRVAEMGLKLDTKIDRSQDTFTGDGKRVTQVLYNLLSNAIGFSEPGGHVELGYRAETDHVLFWVSDTGMGIDEEHQTTIFNRFETNNAGSAHRGVGLGLSIVDSFVKLHGGEVILESEVGKGTKVTCRFPKRAVAVHSAA